MRTRLLVTLLIVSSPAVAVFGLDSDVARCRTQIARYTEKVATTTMSQELACHRLRMLGDVAADVNCSDLTSPGFPADKLARISDAAVTFAERATSTCSDFTPASLGYASCDSPCAGEVPTISTWSDAAACLSCLAKHHASVTVDEAYGAAPPILGDRTDTWKCQTSYIGKGMYAYARKQLGKQRTCQGYVDHERIGPTDCKTVDLTGAIGASAARVNNLILSCTTGDLAALTSCASTVAGEQSCVRGAIDTMCDTLFDAIYPQPPPTPTATTTNSPAPTDTPTLTRTPTSTPTRTATASPTASVVAGSCPTANFLDVASAPGPGAGYPTPSLSVSCTATQVEVTSNSIPHYTFIQTTPNALRADIRTMRFPLSPAVAASTTTIPLLGKVGVAVNGIQLFGPNEAQIPDPYGDPVANAILDECLGHTSQTTYHYHALVVKCLIASGLVAQPWDNPDPPTDQPSPIIAYAFDGFPIYGPYDCVDTDCTQVIQYESSWDNVGYQSLDCTSSAQCTVNYVCALSMINGVKRNACVPKTYAWTNNQYVAKSGQQYLDQCNGHYGPNGDYHYHATDTFPYILGCYRGTPVNNG